jgi:hypothetical protein
MLLPTLLMLLPTLYHFLSDYILSDRGAIIAIKYFACLMSQSPKVGDKRRRISKEEEPRYRQREEMSEAFDDTSMDGEFRYVNRSSVGMSSRGRLVSVAVLQAAQGNSFNSLVFCWL